MKKIDTKMLLQQFLPLSEAEIQDLLHPAQAIFGFFFARFQSVLLSSAQSGSHLAQTPCS
jgi:hypothetical protein